MSFTVGLAESDADLEGILALQRASREPTADGFVTVQHTLEILRAMHALAPSVVARDAGGAVVGYALVMPREARALLPILEPMFAKLDDLLPPSVRWYVMGQIAVAPSHRGSGVFDAMYAEHRARYRDRFDAVITEVATRNTRSIRAHARVGFTTLDVYRDATDEWALIQLPLRDPVAALDNPVWSSLTTVHRGFAVAAGNALRFPPEVAPFLAIEAPGPLAPEALATVGDGVYLLGPEPSVPAGWRLENLGTIVQMVCERRIEVPAGPPIALLDAAQRPAILELAALVYPHYFRPRTQDLGRYHGVLGDGRLDAMIGERMAVPGFREISAVCTHPAAVGRGLARRLLAHASNEIFERGETPFLHVSPANTRAVQLYEQNHYRRRIDVPFWSLQRAN